MDYGFIQIISSFQVDPVMTCYKLVTVEFKWFGLQNRVENFIQRAERRLFTNFHRYLKYVLIFDRLCKLCKYFF